MVQSDRCYTGHRSHSAIPQSRYFVIVFDPVNCPNKTDRASSTMGSLLLLLVTALCVHYSLPFSISSTSESDGGGPVSQPRLHKVDSERDKKLSDAELCLVDSGHFEKAYSCQGPPLDTPFLRKTPREA